MTFRPVLPAPLEKYDRRNEAETRSAIEQQFSQLPGIGGSGADIDGYYIVDRARNAPRHAIVVPRVFGFDRVPASPNAMDDEMVTAGTGYDPAKWSVWSSGATYSADALGGLKIDMSSTGTVLGIEQPFVGSGAGAWGFVTKVCLGSIDGAANSHVGLTVRDSATKHLQWFGLGTNGSGRLYWCLKYNDYNSFNNFVVSGSSIGAPGSHPFGWHYLRVSGDGAGHVSFAVSENGVVWGKVMSAVDLSFVANPNRIGIFTYQSDNPESAYVQSFRRYL